MIPEVFYEKYLERMIKGSSGCSLLVSSTLAKYIAEDKTLMDAQASAIKAVEPAELFPGQVLGVRFVLNSGKTYTFTDTGGFMTPKIKSRLKK